MSIVAHHTPKCFCPKCGYKFDRASKVYGEGTPKPGDITLCLKCGHVMVFGPGMVVREPTSEEQASIAQDERITRARSAIQKLKHQMG